ncbi:hypothetical protein FGO68_gene10065 [Halteria grandinella]|uniref:histidine kinase n=1 Tax=Halteria grandinella TaxID=5974 RepID=A0A8J8T6D9_HALGN|nr:hypothetical protein FGO68_gene10065 [Halteria grandinella]
MSKWIELEKQKNLSKLKTLAFAQAAHEFRNPLNGITSSLQLLENMYDKEKGEQYFRTAKSCANLMLSLVRDILDMSQLETRSLVLNYQKCNIEDIISECLDLFQISASQRQINLSMIINLSQSTRKMVTDAIRCKQILINLISNALKYTQQFGTIKVLAEYDNKTRQIAISIDDTGVGMSQTQMKRLFSNFTKFMADRQLNKEGVGLGLNISRNIARALGGDITFKSKIGVGSCFTLHIPIGKKPYKCLSFSDIINDKIQNKESISTLDEANFNEIQPVEMDQISVFFSKENEFKNENMTKILLSSEERNILNLKSSYTNNHADDAKINQQPSTGCICSPLLIADDEPMNLLVLSGMLQQMNYPIPEKANNGREAMDHRPFRIVLLDNQMPLMSGIEVAKAVRNMQHRNLISPKLKLLLLTGEDLGGRLIHKELFDQVLAKPINSTLLQKIIQKYLQ